MGNTVLLFASRDLCYESNWYFIECMAQAFEEQGFLTEICDLSIQMEEKLYDILNRRKQFLAAFDFNSRLPRLQLEDKTPYLTALGIPFFNYLVDHPLYHHIGIKRGFAGYKVICIDVCHQSYIKKYYPHIENAFYLPLGAMKAAMERSLSQKRRELLFLGTYEPEEALYDQLKDYPKAQKEEISALLEMMDADPELTQEEALMRFLTEKGERASPEEFRKKMNADFLADKILRNVRRKKAILAAAAAKTPFLAIGHGLNALADDVGLHVTIRGGIGFAASLQMIANARMLLNVTPGFCGGLHDRVYSAMINRTVCFTEGSRFAKEQLLDGKDAILYDSKNMGMLTEQIAQLSADVRRQEDIAECAWQKAVRFDTWQKRVERIMKWILPL